MGKHKLEKMKINDSESALNALMRDLQDRLMDLVSDLNTMHAAGYAVNFNIEKVPGKNPYRLKTLSYTKEFMPVGFSGN